MSAARRASWTPERRAASAERLRLRNAQPEFKAAKKSAWSPERRAAASARFKQQNADPEFAAKRLAWLYDPARKSDRSKAGFRMQNILASNPDVRRAWHDGLAEANGRPEKRKHAAEVMRKTMARPEMREKVRELGRTKDHSAVARKGHITRKRNRIEAERLLKLELLKGELLSVHIEPHTERAANGTARKISDTELQGAVAMQANGMSWREAADALGRSFDGLVKALKARGYITFESRAPLEVLEERDRRHARAPRDFTAAHFGDPEPGRRWPDGRSAPL